MLDESVRATKQPFSRLPNFYKEMTSTIFKGFLNFCTTKKLQLLVKILFVQFGHCWNSIYRVEVNILEDFVQKCYKVTEARVEPKTLQLWLLRNVV